MRVFYEAELAEKVCLSTLGINPALPDLLERARSHDLEDVDSHAHAARRVHGNCLPGTSGASSTWRQFLGVSPGGSSTPATGAMPGRCCPGSIGSLPDALRPVWHEAYENEYRNSLITRLVSERQRTAAYNSHERPRPQAQAVFCIDARSKLLPPSSEAQAEYDTIGFAGFFRHADRLPNAQS